MMENIFKNQKYNKIMQYLYLKHKMSIGFLLFQVVPISIWKYYENLVH
jgi:hypothetical protein